MTYKMDALSAGVSLVHLDASESAHFASQLRYIAPTLYDYKYGPLEARSLISTIQGVPEWAPAFVYRGYKSYGKAKIISAAADDLPMADVEGGEATQLIKPIGLAFGYTRDEIRASMATGSRLSDRKATACRRGIDTLIDEMLATGDASTGITGALNIAAVTPSNVAVKTGGGRAWALAGAPTAEEMVADVFELVGTLHANTKKAFKRFHVVVPIAQFNIALAKKMGDGDAQKMYQHILAHPYVASFSSWDRCAGAGATASDRMAAWPSQDSGGGEALGALVPQEFLMEMPQDRNLATVVNCTARCGGVVPFYPAAIGYRDAI